MIPEVSAEAKVTALLRPARSQVLLVAFAGVCIIALLCGTYLLGEGKQEGWGLVAIAALIFFGCLWAWNKSHSDSDLINAHPTSLNLSDGTSITTDTRTLRSPTSAYSLVLLIQEALLRKPLPSPDAMVDGSFQPVPDSKDEAIAAASLINQQIQSDCNIVLDSLGLTDDGAQTLQEVINESPSAADLTKVQESLNQPFPEGKM